MQSCLQATPVLQTGPDSRTGSSTSLLVLACYRGVQNKIPANTGLQRPVMLMAQC